MTYDTQLTEHVTLPCRCRIAFSICSLSSIWSMGIPRTLRRRCMLGVVEVLYFSCVVCFLENPVFFSCYWDCTELVVTSAQHLSRSVNRSHRPGVRTEVLPSSQELHCSEMPFLLYVFLLGIQPIEGFHSLFVPTTHHEQLDSHG